MDFNTVARNQDDIGPTTLTNDEIPLVSGGVKVEFDIPPHIYIPLMVDHYVRTAVILAPFAPVAVAAAAMGLFDSWAEPKLSTTRKSN